jgi:polyhydroxyalkanoate synthesis repressor PhaR
MTRTIKRYANRKLYDTEESHYVGLQDILRLVREGEDIEVVDSRTGEDLTSVTLAQAMAEEEKTEGSALPLDVLKELIKRGSDSLNEIMRKSRLAGKGAFHMAEEGATKYLEKLMDQGEMSEDEAKRYLRGLSRTVTNRRRSLDAATNERVRAFVKAMRLPSREEFDKVAKKVDAIAEKLDAYISGSPDRKRRPKKRK